MTTKCAIVTGSSSGIGRSTARRLASRGFSILLAADASDSALAEAAEECRSQGSAASHFRADLGVPEACEEMVARAIADFGRVDVLVNNAAIRIRHPFGDFTPAEFDHAVAVNLRAPFLSSQAVLPYMRRQGGGRIIHVASQIGIVAFDQSALYGLTKAALIYLSRAMAYELAKDRIIVNAVSPGPIATEYNLDRMQADPGFRARRETYVPQGRFGEPEEVAEAIVFLADSDGAYIQGHNLVIDGGYIIH